MNRCGNIASAFVVLAASLSAMSAQADSGLYLGGGIGQAKIEDSAGNPGGVGFSESDTAWKGFIGYNFDFIPLIKFAAEVGYRDMGKADSNVAGVPVEYSLNGIDYSALAGFGLGPVDILARVGGMHYELEKNVGGVRRDFDGSAPLYGLGVWFTLAGIGLRAEYEYVDIDELDKAEMFTVSAFYKF